MAPVNKGLLKVAQGKSRLADIPVPDVPDDSILVKTVTVAINPTDWQTLDEEPTPAFTYSLLGVDTGYFLILLILLIANVYLNASGSHLLSP